MNVAKVALIIIVLLLMIVIFFALTGLDVKNPMPAVERMIAWSSRTTRSINAKLRIFFSSIRNRLFGQQSSETLPNMETGETKRPLKNIGQAINNLMEGFFGSMRDSSEENFVEPVNP